jgi:hypothetical protein
VAYGFSQAWQRTRINKARFARFRLLKNNCEDLSLIALVINCTASNHSELNEGVTFPRFHRHLPKWETEEIGGQDEYEDTTVVYGGV